MKANQEQEVRSIVRNQVKGYAAAFEDPHMLELDNEDGVINSKVHNIFVAALNQPDLTVMAMGTLASGYLAPEEAYSYMNAFPSVQSIVVGTSSTHYIASTFLAIRQSTDRR